MPAPFGVGPREICMGIALVKRICEAQFVSDRRADARYLQFVSQIRGLGTVLTRVNERLAYAADEYSNQLVLQQSTTLCDPNDDGLEGERKKLVGDFEATLTACKVILDKYSEYLRNPSGFGANMLWEFRIQDKIDKLVCRVKFHIHKMSLVMQQLQHGLLRDMAASLARIDRNVADIHNVVVTGTLQASLPTALKVPDTLAIRFTSAFMAADRPVFTDPRQAPIQEGFDALLHHWLKSTVQSPGRLGCIQPLEQYINLMKALWLSQKLKETTQYEASFYYMRATLRVEQLISEEFHRPDLTQYTEEDFKLVDLASFAIWNLDDMNIDSMPEDEVEMPKKILELPLRDLPGTLRVFGTSETELLLLSPVPSLEPGLPAQDRVQEVDVHSHRFEPVYATSLSSDSTYQVKISLSTGKGVRPYDFTNIDHVYDFQRAFTGFKVVHNRMNVDWSIDGKKLTKARVQIWQYKPLLRKAVDLPQPQSNSPSNSSIRSGASAATTRTLAQSISQGLNPSIVSIVRTPAALRAPAQENIVHEKAPLPVLMMFTEIDSKRAFLHLALRSEIKVNPGSCQCRFNPSTCRQVVLEFRLTRKTSSPFDLRVLTENLKKTPPQPWDLSILGVPRHPLFQQRVKSLRVPYLSLYFATIDEKDSFLKAFNTISRLQGLDNKDYTEADSRFRMRSNQPNAVEPLRRPSTASIPLSRASTAPVNGSVSSENDLGRHRPWAFRARPHG